MTLTRAHQLKFCKVCNHHQHDLQRGIVCSLTGLPATFTQTCESFAESTALKQKQQEKHQTFQYAELLADNGTRLANYILDLIFLYIFSFIFSVTLGFVLAIFAPQSLNLFANPSSSTELIYGLFLAAIYFTFLEATTGKTIAKLITKTKVVNEKGNRPGWGTIFIRTFTRLIPFEPLTFLGGNRSGWHDQFSNTYVIRSR
jgi:uncharacterized RDD family membrane protein YckC